jgi:gentisate 1,2-dioxygenase
MNTPQPINPPTETASADVLSRFSRGIAPLSVMPLWERTARMKPGSACVPHRWRYAELRGPLEQACGLITKRDAERRVLVLENPSLRGSTFATQTLYAGLQIIIPGEIAPSHRHSPSALRFIVEGEGAYTAVEGERIDMHPGDFIVTPNWTWHEHGNTGKLPVVWLDGLDTAMVAQFGAMFREDAPTESYAPANPSGESVACFGSNMLPVDHQPRAHTSTPLRVYRYTQSRAALAALARARAPDPVHGYKLRYAHPGTGGHPFPTMAVYLQHLPAGFAGQPWRSTESVVCCVVEGTATAVLGGDRFEVGPRDLLAIPPWIEARFESTEGAVIFSYGDRAAQESLGLLREERL